MKRIFIVLIFLSLSITALCEDLNYYKKINITEDKDDFIQIFSSFVISDDNEIIVADGKAANVKVFDKNGTYIYPFGNKGRGPGEFITPFSLFLKNKELWVNDIRSMKITKFMKENNKYVYKDKDIQIFSSAYQTELKGNKIYLSSYAQKDKMPYRIFSTSIDNKTDKIDYLINDKLIYDVNKIGSDKHYSRYYPAVNFCIDKNNLYAVWSGKLRVVKLNINDKSTEIIAHKSSNFIQPQVDKELINAYKMRNSKTLRELKKNIGLVGGVFVAKEKLCVIFRGKYNPKNKTAPIFIQFFNKNNGKFIKEVKLKGIVGDNYMLSSSFYYSQNNSTLYFLNRIELIDDDRDYKYELLCYKINEK